MHLKRTVVDIFPLASQFRQEICDLPAVHVDLRNFLDAEGANLAQHSSLRVVMTLAHGLYEETEDTQAAIEMAREIVAAVRRQRVPSPSSSSHGEQSPVPKTSGSFSIPTKKVAHNVAVCMKENDKNFRGLGRVLDGVRTLLSSGLHRLQSLSSSAAPVPAQFTSWGCEEVLPR